MAFEVETGSGSATATSYISVADADAYATEVGLTAWTGLDAVKETALIKAQRFITQCYRGSWKGTRANETQALDWPRNDVWDQDGYLVSYSTIPAALKEAQVELAVRALTADLVSDLTTSDVGIGSESSSVGSVSYSVTFMGGKATQASYPVVERLLSPYCYSGGEIVRG
jgi:hypothetical protein